MGADREVQCGGVAWAAVRGALTQDLLPVDLAKAIAFAMPCPLHWLRTGLKGPASARPAPGGRFSPARSGAVLNRSRVASGSGREVSHGRGEAMPRLLPPEQSSTNAASPSLFNAPRIGYPRGEEQGDPG
ncbi:hypothetical protein GCM10011341_14860 [Frigidibacter albus]|nr:hypothetical protein GCM10011341_14860 [Frigidibacter albus]